MRPPFPCSRHLSLKVKAAYLDGELRALDAEGVPVFSRLQAAMDEGKTDQLVFFAFDLLFLNGEEIAQLPRSSARSAYSGSSRRRSHAFAIANTLRATDRGSEHSPASWTWRALTRSEPIGLTLQATAGSGSSPVPQSRGIRSCRLDCSRARPPAHRRAAVGLLRRGWPPPLGKARWDWHYRQETEAPGWRAEAARSAEDAACWAATKRQRLRFTAQAQRGALGEA